MTQKHRCVLPMTSCLVEGLGSWCVFVGVVQNPRQKAAHECWTSGFEFADKFINLFLFFALCCYSSSSLVFRTYRKSSIRHVMRRMAFSPAVRNDFQDFMEPEIMSFARGSLS
jgi:hypothetical protein